MYELENAILNHFGLNPGEVKSFSLNFGVDQVPILTIEKIIPDVNQETDEGILTIFQEYTIEKKE